MTALREHSQCPLVEMDSITSLFIVYRYDSTTATFTVPLVEMDTITSLFIVYRYDSTTGIFTVPPGGDGFYYFSIFLTTDGDESSYFDIQSNGEILCTVYSDLTESPTSDSAMVSCGGATFAVEGIIILL